MSDRRHFDLFVAFDLALLASLPLTDTQAPMVLTGSLTLGRRVAPLSVPYAYP